jgi:hypothetical protein
MLNNSTGILRQMKSNSSVLSHFRPYVGKLDQTMVYYSRDYSNLGKILAYCSKLAQIITLQEITSNNAILEQIMLSNGMLQQIKLNNGIVRQIMSYYTNKEE